jgi:very-short-patch-repair endonuclease
VPRSLAASLCVRPRSVTRAVDLQGELGLARTAFAEKTPSAEYWGETRVAGASQEGDLPMHESAHPALVELLPLDAVAGMVLDAAPGQVTALGGISSEQLRAQLHETEPRRDGRLALFLDLAHAAGSEALVERVLDLLAETALRTWPVWFTDVSFADCGRDALGREAARRRLIEIARETKAVSPAWAELALLRAGEGRRPRVPGMAREIEIAQLCLAIHRAGLILVAEAGAAVPVAEGFVHGLEWIARHANLAVVVLFGELPEAVPPFDRILYRACRVAPAQCETAPQAEPDSMLWLDPVLGRPHPLSSTEQRLAQALGRDAELRPLFGFNQFVDTARGTRPKVDLLWRAGRVVVELDGFSDHGTFGAFLRDRNRDYELTVSGYVVVRLANDEVAQDIDMAIEKIRDVVRMRRAHS